MRFTVRTKLVGSFLLVLLLSAMAGGYGAYMLSAATNDYGELVDREESGAIQAQELRATFLLQVKAAKDTLLRGSDPADLTKYLAEFDTHGKLVQQQRDAIREHENWMGAAQKENLRQFDTGYAGYLQAWKETSTHFKADPETNQRSADALIKGKDRDAIAALDAVAVDLHSIGDKKSNELREDGAFDIKVVAIGLLLALGAGLTLGLFVAQLVSRSVSQAAKAAAGIAVGDLDQKVDVKNDDELGDMARSFGDMVDYLKEYAGIAKSIADGDLSRELKPKSEKDVLGNALARAGETGQRTRR